MGWKFRGLILMAGGLAVMPGAVHAQTQSYFNLCGFDSSLYMGCSSAEAVWTGNNLVLKVWNMEGYGPESIYGRAHTITAVGLSYLGLNSQQDGVPAPTVGSWSVLFGGTDVSSYWKLGAKPLQLELGGETDTGHKGGIVGCTDPGPPSANHMSTCGNYPNAPYLQFSFNDIQNAQAAQDYWYEFHSQQTGEDGNLSLKASGPGEPDLPEEVVPEPVSMLLLGTGLAGVGAMRRRRGRAGCDRT